MIQINRIGTQYADNVIDPLLSFNTPQTWNVTSGTGSVVISNASSFEGSGSLELQTTDAANRFVVTNTLQSSVIDVSGSYGLSLYLSKKEVKNISGKVKIFKNNVLFATESFANFTPLNKWVLFVTQEKYTFAKNDVITFTFEIDAEAGTTIKNLFIDGLKLFRYQTNQLTPTFYTRPLNTVFPADTGAGFGYYIDSFYTSAAPLLIANGETKSIIINNATKIEGALPLGIPTFYDGTKILAYNNLDSFLYTFKFNAKNSTTNSYGTLSIDIGGAFGEIFKTTINFPRGANIEHPFFLTLDGYTGATFLANGGIPKITSNSGTISMYDIALKVTRTIRAL